MATERVTQGASPDQDWIRDVRRRVLRWGPAHWQDFPWRHSLPLWQGLVAEVLLQRTRSAQVVPVFREFRQRYPSAARFSRATAMELAVLIAPLGLRWRVPLLHRLANDIGRRRGRIPTKREELENLPGVGPYAAAATLSFHGGKRAAIVDANVVRVLCRLTGMPFDGETRRKRWMIELADRLTPPRAFRRYNYALLDLAMTVCMAGQPRCRSCPLSPTCVRGQQELKLDSL